MQDFLQGIGLFLCVGAIALVALAVIGIRSFTNRRGTGPVGPVDRGADQWNDIESDRNGPESPRYNDREIRSTGGIGSAGSTIPATGAREYDDDREVRGSRPLHADRDITDRDPFVQSDDDLARRERRRGEDDDEIRSRGGFGS